MTILRLRRSFLLAALACGAAVQPSLAADRQLEEATDFTGTIMSLGGDVPGLLFGAVRNGETALVGFGETRDGNGKEPDENSIFRIASVSKVFCGSVLGSMVIDGLARPDRPAAGLCRRRRDGAREGRPHDPPRRPRDAVLGPAARGAAAGLARGGPVRLQHPRGRVRRARRTTRSSSRRAPRSPTRTSATTSSARRSPTAGGKPYADLLRERVLDPPRHEGHHLQPAGRRDGPADAGPLLRRQPDAERADAGRHRMRRRPAHHRRRHAEVDPWNLDQDGDDHARTAARHAGGLPLPRRPQLDRRHRRRRPDGGDGARLGDPDAGGQPAADPREDRRPAGLLRLRRDRADPRRRRLLRHEPVQRRRPSGRRSSAPTTSSRRSLPDRGGDRDVVIPVGSPRQRWTAREDWCSISPRTDQPWPCRP